MPNHMAGAVQSLLVLVWFMSVYGLLFCPCLYLCGVFPFHPVVCSDVWCCVDTFVLSLSVHICVWSFIMSLSLSFVCAVFL